MKSAYELAMERLEQREGKRAALTDAQKAQISEIESQLKAKIAELEIMMEKNLAEARGAGDQEKIALLQRAKADEIEKARRRAESDKEKVRGG